MDLSLITYYFILPLLQYFKELCGNYGWAIIAVTVVIKGILYPLTKHQTSSMQKLQVLQPKIKILQERFESQKEKYKDKPEKLKSAQEEFQKDMIEFYQKNNVNPMGGCLPMLVQLPVLIALFWAFNGSPFKPLAITAPITILEQNQTINEEIRGASKPSIYIGNKGEKGRLVVNPGEVRIPVDKELKYSLIKLDGNIDSSLSKVQWEISDKPVYVAGYEPKDIESFADIKVNEDKTILIKAKKPGKLFLNAVLPASSENDKFLFISGLGKTGAFDPETKTLNIDVIILVILFGFTIWLSGLVTAKSTPPAADAKQAEMQKTMQQIMPGMVAVMTLMFPVPSGVLLYFVVSGFIQALQTWMIMRSPVKLNNAEAKI